MIPNHRTLTFSSRWQGLQGVEWKREICWPVQAQAWSIKTKQSLAWICCFLSANVSGNNARRFMQNLDWIVEKNYHMVSMYVFVLLPLSLSIFNKANAFDWIELVFIKAL